VEWWRSLRRLWNARWSMSFDLHHHPHRLCSQDTSSCDIYKVLKAHFTSQFLVVMRLCFWIYNDIHSTCSLIPSIHTWNKLISLWNG
jgi:hypothetical protein